MAWDTYIKIDGIPGESTDSKHKDWIEILSYTWGVEQLHAGSRSQAGAASSQRCDHKDFTFVHALDKASPKLFLACADGTHIKNIVVELCRATGDKTKYMEYKLYDSIITGVQPGGASQDAGAVPLEEVSINYGKIELVYTLTDHMTGKPSGDVKAGWDLTKNVKV
jgi:type VI secretion system secreted protein Hcp